MGISSMPKISILDIKWLIKFDIACKYELSDTEYNGHRIPCIDDRYWMCCSWDNHRGFSQ